MGQNEKNNEIIVSEILDNIKEYFGFVPKIFQVLSENPSALKAYYLKFEAIIKNNSLDPLTMELVAVGAASALGAEHCLSTHLKVARELGANDNQLLNTILMGTMIAETDALASSLRVYESFK
ncbi:carboxymuconolactone decarboxylase family protein [Methanobacterium alcaliphilum]|uniref:carboxymuconolactone decarboxylase family protein n=1 Tax=Methanobacterium alcaliphilum TaxID=392018 RepID=UPI00200B080F|nr:carboxymuconolactone decarboxylase family protein [Methanobacterium alcaliphilum]MCK9151938.1 carboxymuconolactone decarboxylase family protein [Methanobacterium alcaliphilum]